MIDLQPFREEDWDTLLELANQAVPFAPHQNAEWLNYRKAFDESKFKRRHYIATDKARHIGYGCLEQQNDDPKGLRIFVVCHPDNLGKEVGAVLYDKLLQDAKEMGAEHLWAREYQADEPLRDFFLKHGFEEAKRFTLPNDEPMIVYTLAVSG